MVCLRFYTIGVSRTVTCNITTLATSNTYSSRFLTPVLPLALKAAHWEPNIQSAIESQVPRMYSIRRLHTVQHQDNKLAKGDTLISVRRSSALLLLTTEIAPPAASVQGSSPRRDMGRGHGEVFLNSAPGSTPNQWDQFKPLKY
ncbi:hypothetical protein PoB_004024800 [Plakobranchus ocellatus]|uniref:Uncharacterized protein n=1 Tax=Plakobranchus ocellatus TaxID=259542 RepID=A0AAV4B3Q8_9GAST|nr:hypothetical protein PoB_004024800 [Plakobranchus ocellatus]